MINSFDRNTSQRDTKTDDFSSSKMQMELATKLLFSGLDKGYINREGNAVLQVRPNKTLTLQEVYEYIVSDDAKEATNQLRQISEHKKAQEFKKLNFRLALFGGVFSKRKANALAQASGAMVIDIDDLESQEEVNHVIDLLIHDPRLKVLLCFRSPSGNGVKCVILIDTTKNLQYKEYFGQVYRQILFEHGIKIDTSGSDICRACYLPHDPECYINPLFLT